MKFISIIEKKGKKLYKFKKFNQLTNSFWPTEHLQNQTNLQQPKIILENYQFWSETPEGPLDHAAVRYYLI